MRKIRLLVIVLMVFALGMVLVGCAKPPEAEREAAKKAMDAAITRGAEKYASSDLEAARKLWDTAESQMKEKKYKEAKQSYMDAKAAFEKAAAAVAAGKKAVADQANATLKGLEEKWEKLLVTANKMEKKLRDKKQAWTADAKAISVIDFDSRVVILQPFSNDGAALEKAIRDTSVGGSTSLYNAVYIALNEMKKLRAKSVEDIRRQAIGVLSDGEDTSSLLPFEEVLELAKRSVTAIYAIGLHSKEPRVLSSFNEADFVLKSLSHEAGGRAFFPQAASELDALYAQIGDELSSQYTLGYTSKSPRRNGAWRRIVLRLNRPNAIPRTRQGYYAPTQ